MGLIAASPELSASVGLFIAAIAVGRLADSLAHAFVDVFENTLGPNAAFDHTTDSLTRLVSNALLPFLPVVSALALATALGSLVSHQLQLGGYWQPNLLAPRLDRLWSTNRHGPIGSRFAQGLWSLAKPLLLAVVVCLSISADPNSFQRIARADLPVALRIAGEKLSATLSCLALACLALGAVDAFIRFRRIESILQMTPDEARQDQRTVEGDPETRRRRDRLARQWRLDSRELPPDVALLIGGAGSIVVLVGGQKPPGAIVVRAVARGVEANRWRRAAQLANLPVVESPPLARVLSLPATKSRGLPPELVDQLAAIWPAKP
jgi:flagellar biosynthesis protein FlhB